MRENRSRRLLLLKIAKAALIGIFVVLSARMLVSKPAPHVPKSIVSDWSHRHVLYRESGDDSGKPDFDQDPRREQSWYLRHPEAWWPEYRHGHRHESPEEDLNRDWSLNLGASTSSTVINFSFVINTTETAYGSVSVTDQGGGVWLATFWQPYDYRWSGCRNVEPHCRRAWRNPQPLGKVRLRQPDYSFGESGPRYGRAPVWNDDRGNQRLGQQRQQLFVLRLPPPLATVVKSLQPAALTSSPRLAGGRVVPRNIRLMSRPRPAARTISWPWGSRRRPRRAGRPISWA